MTRDQTRRWRDLDRKHLWHPFTPMRLWAGDDPLVIERGEGFELIDSDGRRYVDGVGSLWCNLHGHRVPEIDSAVRDQLDKIAHSTLLGLASPPSIELAERLVGAADEAGRLSRVFYSDAGATAVEIAAKMAFQYWRLRGQRRSTFIALSDSYHGDTLGSVSLGGIDMFHSLFRPLLFDTVFVAAPCEQTHPAGADAAKAVLAEIETALTTREGEICAVVVEPLVQGAGGVLTHPPGFLRALRDLTRRCDTLLIADEVATGFCRTGAMFACHHERVTPDLMCLAKGISGGYLPLAATLTTEEIFEAFLGEPDRPATFFHGHTYTGNALACAAAIASFDLIGANGVLDAAGAKIDRIAAALAEMEAIPQVARTRQRGFMVGVDLARPDGEPFDPAARTGAAVCRAIRDCGVIIRPLGDTLVLMPAPGIDPDSLERLLAGVAEGLTRRFGSA